MKNSDVSISFGNSKMGAVPSVSLPPIVTCAPGCACAKKCYAAKLCRLRPNVRDAYARNLDMWESDPDRYFRAVGGVVALSRYFRFHVSGDIPNADYFRRMIDLAKLNPHCELLAFTKRYDIVNAAADQIPENLHMIFSEWPGMDMDNPHNLPVAHVVFRREQPLPEWKQCGGNCQTCAAAGVGCWTLTRGEHICFNEH